MRTGQDVLDRALHLLQYTAAYSGVDGEQNATARFLAAVNQIYSDLWHIGETAPFMPLCALGEVLALPARQLEDVMPYGVAMLLALSEGDGDSQQIYATIYNRKRSGIGSRTRRDVLFGRKREAGACNTRH